MILYLIVISLLSGCASAGGNSPETNPSIGSPADASTTPSLGIPPTQPTQSAGKEEGKQVSYTFSSRYVSKEESDQTKNLQYQITNSDDGYASIHVYYRGDDAFEYHYVSDVRKMQNGDYNISIRISKSGFDLNDSGHSVLTIKIPGYVDPDATVYFHYTRLKGEHHKDYSYEVKKVFAKNCVLKARQYTVVRSAEQAARFLPKEAKLTYDEEFFKNNILLLANTCVTPAMLKNEVSDPQLLADGSYLVHVLTSEPNIANAIGGDAYLLIMELRNVDPDAEVRFCQFFRIYSP
jgi:hypothetical protein